LRNNMPRFNVKAPDGSIIPVDAPDGATEQDAIAFAASIYKPAAPLADRVAQIPGGATPAPAAVKQDRSVMDVLGGVLETPLALGSAVVGGFVRPAASVVGELFSPAKAGSPEATAAGQQAMRQVSRGLYAPQTQTGQDIMGGVSDAMGFVANALPMQPMGTLTATANALAAPAMRQAGSMAAPLAKQATAPITNALTRQGPQMPGMGAANTAEDLIRTERLQRLDILNTLGERTKNLPQQQFESRAQLGSIPGLTDDVKTAIQEQMTGFRANQKQSIANNFARMSDEVGAEVVGPAKVGEIVDEAINAQFKQKKADVDKKYLAADTAGESFEQVSYKPLTDFIATFAPTTRATIDPILNAVSEMLAMNDPLKTGMTTARALDDIYKQAGKVQNSANAYKIKQLVNDITAGVSGSLYREARTARLNLAKQFEDVAKVDALLSTKTGYADRKVAIDKVFDHVVLNGSLEEMRTVTKLLKKGGAQGQQAMAELRGQTIQHLEESLIKGDQMSVAAFTKIVNQLDRERKLEYLFGKQGRDHLLDLRDGVRDVLVKQPGAVNYSGTASVVLQGLEKLAAIRFPLAKTAANVVRTREIKSKVNKALQQPNQLAPPATPTNNLAP
jgi:hypothetical protein